MDFNYKFYLLCDIENFTQLCLDPIGFEDNYTIPACAIEWGVRLMKIDELIFIMNEKHITQFRGLYIYRDFLLFCIKRMPSDQAYVVFEVKYDEI